jgi:PhnB protein
MSSQLRQKPIILDAICYLIVADAARAIDYYRDVFGAEETFRLDYEGKIGHAELKFGPTTIMLADEFADHGIRSPLAFGGTGVRIHLHVDDVDSIAARAAESGSTILYGPADEPHGERQCRLRDPFGHEWLLGHQFEQLSPDEIRRRYAST